MDLISLKYCIFVVAALVLYYLFPKKYRWCVLLAASMTYYVMICKWYVVFLLFTISTTYGAAIWIQHMLEKQNAVVKAHKEEWDRETRKKYRDKGLHKRMAVLIVGLILNFGILAFLKIPVAADLGLLLPLGISFYTFQSMGYLIDVYREIVEPEKNYFKLALFVSFFPQIIQGPIAIYDKLAAQLYEGHSFNYERIKKALLLILWGIMKKLIIADRAVNIINVVTGDLTAFSGKYILFAALVYALQLYADFSGGIDIVRGVGELFGIDMPINFNRPYFSRSLTEYWHRWHMTLGDWCRNYIFYPLSISKSSMNFSKWLKPKFGNHIAKVFPGCVASLITFLVIGVWHGANMKYVYFGLWNGLVIMIAELIAPLTAIAADKLSKVTHLKKQGVVATIISVLWTFLLVLVGYYFDIAGNATEAFSMLTRSVTEFNFHLPRLMKVRMTLDATGLSYHDYIVLIVSTVLLFAVSFAQEKSKKQMRDVVMGLKLPLRWLVIFVGIFAVLLFGYYGAGANPADFVYMQF